jgi:nicotinamidase/pyrazinamidase
MRALILVDLQYDFMPGGALAVSDGDATVAVANQLTPRFELVVATQDWHPADHGSFITQHPHSAIGNQIQLDGLAQTVWPVHCVQNTRGAELHGELDRSQIDCIIHKGTERTVDSYSGFFDNARRKSTGLADYLKARGVDEVFVLGLATDYCVKFTALDANSLGFRTHLITDACRAVNLTPGDDQRAFAECQAAGIDLIQSANITKR